MLLLFKDPSEYNELYMYKFYKNSYIKMIRPLFNVPMMITVTEI